MVTTVGQNQRVFSDLGNGGVAKTIDFASVNICLLTLNINACVLTLEGLESGQYSELWLKQGALGLKTVVWPVTNISWGDDGVPTLSTVEGKIDMFCFRTDGTILYPKLIGKGF